MEGMLSHQLEQNRIDGEKTIIQAPSEAQRKEHEKFDFSVHEVRGSFQWKHWNFIFLASIAIIYICFRRESKVKRIYFVFRSLFHYSSACP